MAKIGGREIHPINVRVGGFYKVFKKQELQDLVEQLKWARDAALETVRWTAKLPFQEFEQDYEFVALRHPNEYPLNEGRLVSNGGLDINISKFDQHFEEKHVEHSNALHSVLKERGAYFVGPMARFNLNFDRLSHPLPRKPRQQAGLPGKCKNPFKSIIVRSVEVLYACDEALRISGKLRNARLVPISKLEPKAGTGYGCTEAPRGILYHRYSGSMTREKFWMPRSFLRLRKIKKPLKTISGILFPNIYIFPDAELTWQCEQAIRNYDPCISCATHFLKLEMDRQ